MKRKKKKKKILFEDIKKSEIKKEFTEEKYDIERVCQMIELHRSIVVCGPSGSGKSQLMKYLYNKYKHLFELTIVFSGSYFDLEYVEEGVPENLHQPLNEIKINAIIDALKLFKQKGIQLNCLLIFDDVTGNLDLRYNKLIDSVVTQCRHFNCSTIISAHWLSKLSRVILESVKYFFVFQSTRESLSRIKEYTNFKEDELWNLYSANTSEEYSFMFVQKMKANKKICYFCKPLPNVRTKMIGKIL